MSTFLNIYQVTPHETETYFVPMGGYEILMTMFPSRPRLETYYDIATAFLNYGLNIDDYRCIRETGFYLEYAHNDDPTNTFKLSYYDLPVIQDKIQVIYCKEVFSEELFLEELPTNTTIVHNHLMKPFNLDFSFIEGLHFAVINY